MAETLDYSAVQVAKDRDYAAAYEKWTTSLSEDEKARLADLDIAEPKIDRKASGPTLATDDFRNSTSTAGSWVTNHTDDGWHPGMPIPEDAEEIDAAELKRLARFDPEVIGSVMRILFVPDLGRGVKPRAVVTKLFAMAHALHIEGVGDRSLMEIAKELGVTRAVLSHYALKVRDFASLDCRAGWSQLARDRMAASKLWNTNAKGRPRKKKKKAGTTIFDESSKPTDEPKGGGCVRD